MERRPAKTTPPRAGDAIERPRLFELLDARPASWVVAPAGAGKSTLVRSYAAARCSPLRWYRVDASDGDPHTLFDYLGRGDRSLPRPRGGAIAPFAARFFERVYAGFDEGALLVIDDCHAAGDALEWGETLRAAVLALPEGVRLVLISRSGPPAPVSSLIARGALGVIEWRQLRFTREETALFLTRRGAAQSVEEAHLVTDGWIAALVLLAERGGASPRLELGQPLFDLLSFEVFDRLSAEARAVLVSTALLPSVSEASAVALSQRRGAGEVLRKLASAGLLVERLDTQPPSYRYHALFAAFLRSRMTPVERSELARRAAAVLEEMGEPEQAAALLEEAADLGALAALVRRHAPAWMASGRSATVARWLGGLPAAAVREDAWLSYWQAAVRVGKAPDQAAEDYGRAFERALAAGEEVAAYLAWAGRAQAMALAGIAYVPLAAWRERFDAALGEERLGHLPPEVRAQVSLAMTLLLRTGTDGSAADAWARRAMADARDAADMSLELLAGAMAVLQFGLGGDLPSAARAVARLEQLASENAGEPMARLTQLLTRGLYAYLTVDHAGCLGAVDEALELGDREGIAAWRDSLLVYGVLGALGRDDVERAERYHAALTALPARGRLAEVNLHTVNALLRHTQGEPREALRALAAAAAVARELGGDPIGVALPLSGLAHVALDVGDLELASAAVTELERIARGTTGVMVTYWAHLAAADHAIARGDRDGDRALAAGLAIGRSRGLVQAFFPPRRALSRLLARALEADIESEHARHVIGTLDLPPPEGGAPDAWPRPVCVSTLGRFEITCTSGAIPRPGAPGKLLEALIAVGPRPVGHVVIGDLLWPDADGDTARRALDTNLHRLRRALGRDDVVRLHEGRLSLDPRRCWVDADALDALCERALSEPEAAHEAALFALYQGPFLPTRDEPWVLARRERLRRRFVDAVHALADARAARGEHVDAESLRQRARDVAPEP